MSAWHGAPWLTLVCAAWIVVIWAWPPAELTLTVDDSFYYLRIAQNLASGRGPTFDGVEPTNGFQPLWLAVESLIGLLPFDTAAAMKTVLTLDVALLRVAVALLARQRPRVEAVAAVLLGCFWFTKIFVNGMESALVAALIAACLLAPAAAGPVWGLVGGLLGLARLDAVFFWLPWLVRRPRAAVGLVPLLGAWAALSFAKFGHVLPVSAAVKYGGIPYAAYPIALVAFGAGFVPRLERLMPLVTYAFAALAIGSPLEIWRLVPIALLALWLLSVASPRTLGLVAVAYGGFSVATWVVRLDPRSYAPYRAAQANGLFIREHTPQDAVAAGWDCGIAAAYSRRRFFQLEGLVGSWRFFGLMQAGKTAEFIDAAGVTVIAQALPLFPGAPSLVLDGVDLGGWHVARSECVEFRSIVAPRSSERWLSVVVEREGAGPTLAAVASTACQ